VIGSVLATALSAATAVETPGAITPVPTYVACTEKAADELYSKNQQVLSASLIDAMTRVALAQCFFDILGLRIVNPRWSDVQIRKEASRVVDQQRKTIRSTIHGRYEADQLEGL
jgi:hypothetical protein